MRWYLVRHGRAHQDSTPRFYGRTDPPLDPHGVLQASSLSEAFAGRRLAAIYSSPLLRSVQTAEAIAGATGAVQIEPGLAEMDFGAWEGLAVDAVRLRYANTYRRWYAAPSTVRVPGGEAYSRFRRRVREAFAELARRMPEAAGDRLMVSHRGVIACLLAGWLKADEDRMLRNLTLDYAGISAVDWRPEAVSVGWINGSSDFPCRGGSRARSAGSLWSLSASKTSAARPGR